MNASELHDWLASRRSVRAFRPDPVPRDVLERLLESAITAPSSSNRQPWRFALVTSPVLRAKIVDAIRERVAAIETVVKRGHHGDDYGRYGDFFHEPLAAAPVIVIPQYREHPDLIANLVRSGGGDPADFDTAAQMQGELASTSAAVMLFLLQAYAEGLGACWMAGPTVARRDISGLLGIAPPWKMLGAVALGYPDETPAPKGRKPVNAVAAWFTEDP